MLLSEIAFWTKIVQLHMYFMNLCLTRTPCPYMSDRECPEIGDIRSPPVGMPGQVGYLDTAGNQTHCHMTW